LDRCYDKPGKYYRPSMRLCSRRELIMICRAERKASELVS
jgi:hypothetical protein